MSRSGTRPESRISFLRELDDVHGLAHLEREHLAAGRERRRLQDQLDRLLDAHEVARHGRVGDGHRSARRDLREERRHDRAAAAEHVAEAHRAEHGVASGQPADDLLRHPLGSAHHARRMHGLVGRDHHEPLGAHERRGLDHVRRAEHVRLERLLRVLLQDRHVLVGRRVEDDLGPMLQEHLEHPMPVADVGEDRRGPRPVERHQQVVQVRLVVVEQRQQLRLEAPDLARDLGADRAAGAGDQHALAAQQIPHGGQVRLHLPAPEQVFDAQVAEIARGHAPVDELADRRQHAERHVRLLAQEGHLADQLARRRRDRQQHLVDRERPHERGDRGSVAHHGEPVQRPAERPRVVVDQRDDLEAGLLRIARGRRSGPARRRRRPPSGAPGSARPGRPAAGSRTAGSGTGPRRRP